MYLAVSTPHFYDFSYRATGSGTLSVLRPSGMRRRPASVAVSPWSIEVQFVGPDGTVGLGRNNRAAALSRN